MDPNYRPAGGQGKHANHKGWTRHHTEPHHSDVQDWGDEGYGSDYGYANSDYHHDGNSEKSSKQPVLFVGSLPPESTPEDLQAYFVSIGAKVSVKIIVDWITHRSKQCALVFCDSFETANWLLSFTHDFKGRSLRLDWADSEKRGTKKIETNILFVGNILAMTSEEAIRQYFSKFGDVVHVKCFSNKSTAQNCKNAFVKFSEGQSIDVILSTRHNHRIEGKHVKLSATLPLIPSKWHNSSQMQRLITWKQNRQTPRPEGRRPQARRDLTAQICQNHKPR